MYFPLPSFVSSTNDPPRKRPGSPMLSSIIAASINLLSFSSPIRLLCYKSACIMLTFIEILSKMVLVLPTTDREWKKFGGKKSGSATDMQKNKPLPVRQQFWLRTVNHNSVSYDARSVPLSFPFVLFPSRYDEVRRCFWKNANVLHQAS